MGWHRGWVPAHTHSNSHWQVVAGDHASQILEETTFYSFDRPTRWLTKAMQPSGIRLSVFTFCRTCVLLEVQQKVFPGAASSAQPAQGFICKLLLLFVFKKSRANLDLYSSTSMNQDPATLNTQVTKIGVFPKKEVNLIAHKPRLGFMSNKQTNKLDKTTVNKDNSKSITYKWLPELG